MYWRRGNRRKVLTTESILALLASAAVGHAADSTWTGNGSPSTSWTTSAQNWVPTAGGSATAWTNGTSDTARFSSTAHSTTLTVGTIKGGFISFENNAASYTFNSGTFTAASGGNITLQSTAGTNVTETINTAINFGGTGYAFTNDDTDPNSSLNFGGSIGATNASTQTTLSLNGTGAGTNKISGILSNGTAGLKLGVTINSVAGDATIWELTAANTYTGITSVAGGTLIVANSTGSATGTGNISLSGGTLASGAVGTISGSVNASTNPNQIAPGGVGGIGTLTLGGVNLSGTASDLSTINFDLGAGPAASGIITNGDLLNINGTANIASGTALSFGGTPVLGDDYRLIGGTAVSSITPGNFALPAAPVGDAYSLSTTVDPGFIDLVVGSATSAGPANLTWNNTGASGDGGHWDTTSQNWNNGTGAATYSDTSNTTTGDNVTFNDNNNGNYAVTISGLVHPTSTTFNTNNTSGYVITGANSSSGISGTGSLTLLGTGMVTLSSNDTYSGGTFVNAGTLKLASGTAFPANTALNVSSGAQVTLANHPTGSAAYVPQISMLNNSGTIDITNNALVIQNGSIGTITAQISQAYNNGAWNGTSATGGVISSSAAASDTTHLTAVGVAEGLTSFDGLAVAPTDVLVKYTYYGDADLNGSVDGSDYSRIDNAYLNNLNSSNAPLTGWYNGDFNYDGVINGSDYTLIDNAFNTQGAAIDAAVATAQIAGSGTSAVPEPASLGLLGIGAIGLLRRRRQRRDTTNW
jgi:autotransporter-associated beta strand protein